MKAAVCTVVAVAVLTGCAGTTSRPAASSTSASLAPTASPPATSDPGTSQPLSAADVADPGLPSQVGSGKLSKPRIRQLLQYFENQVAQAYATGRADQLDHYLAGPMLSGNRATIELLAAKNRRNVFRIKVQTVKVQADQKRRVVLDMTGDMQLDYFVDPRTHKVLDNGLPGPSQVQFLVFLDENPANHTWYWTGEQSEADASAGAQSQP